MRSSKFLRWHVSRQVLDGRRQLYANPKKSHNEEDADQRYLATFSTMVGGIVADIYRAENRNTAMAIFAGVSFVGTGLGVRFLLSIW